MTDVRLQEIRKSFGQRTLLDDLALTVASGHYLVLLGASGCGKTTTLKLIAGLLKADRGEIYIGGREVTNVAPRHRGIAMVFQDDSLYPHLTIRRSLAFALRRLNRTEIQQRVDQAAELTGIGRLLDRFPARLSGGELRRAAVAKAIVRRAPLRLFDEPLSALDAPIRDALQRDLLHLHASVPGTTIHVTHDGYEAMRMADSIAVLHEGRILQCGPPEEIYEFPAHREVARAVGTPPINLLSAGTDSGAASIALSQIRFGDHNGGRRLQIGIRSGAFQVIDFGGTASAGGGDVASNKGGAARAAAAGAGDGAAASAEGVVLSGEVERARSLGGSLYVELRCAGQIVTAALPSGPPPQAGALCRLFAPADKVVLFDAENGGRIDRVGVD